MTIKKNVDASLKEQKNLEEQQNSEKKNKLEKQQNSEEQQDSERQNKFSEQDNLKKQKSVEQQSNLNEVLDEDILLKLEQLLEQNQFELVSGKVKHNRLKLIYLMNDAVESFIVFENAKTTGEYLKEYQGEIFYSLSKEDTNKYVLVVHQGDVVLTIWFEKLSMEINLYQYGRTGHFWVKGYESIRQLEYKIAILTDKRDYLGEEYCNKEELELSRLKDFPPLNYCCYPSVPEKYLVPKENPWVPTSEAIDIMKKYAQLVKDESLVKALEKYRDNPGKKQAKKIATMLHRNSHKQIIDYITNRFIEITDEYPKRHFGKANDEKYKLIINKGKKLQKQFAEKNIKTQLYIEEPFVELKDSIEFKVYVLVEKKSILNQKNYYIKLTDSNDFRML